MLTSLLAAELLTFNGTRVASHEAFLLEGGLDFGVVSNQCAGNAETDSAHLASDATATSGNFALPRMANGRVAIMFCTSEWK